MTIFSGLLGRPTGMAGLKRQLSAILTVGMLSGCAATDRQVVAEGEVPVVLGPAVRNNLTPLEGMLACFADRVAKTGRAPVMIGVGDVKDYTGKYSINEGNAITQGGALMVYSALGKMGGAVRMAERFDPGIAERELAYADRRQLGDGRMHEVGGPNGAQTVPWLPYFGGTIQKSDYYIVGGITELNYNVSSGGVEFAVNQIGAKRRTFSQSVGIDLRIVDSRSLVVVKTVSLTKQFNGYEVGFNLFRFFDSDLFDVNMGSKAQEPLQLGIRTALEEAVVRLVSAVTKVDYQPCADGDLGGKIMREPAESLRKVENPPYSFGGVAVGSAVPVNAQEVTGSRLTGQSVQIGFEFGSPTLTGAAMTLIDQIAQASKDMGIEVILVARDTENWDAGKRDMLTDERISAVTSALASRGVSAGAINVTWRPDPADTSIHRDGPGLQEIAKIRVGG